jgi:hypothetical protein
MKTSRSLARRLLLSTTMLAGTVGSLLLSGFTATAADLPFKAQRKVTEPLDPPAVDGWNVKAEGYGGSIAGRSFGGGQGSITAPLPGPFGVQIDGGAGRLDGRMFDQVAGHLFWRNPNQALFGLYVSNTFWDQFGGVNVTHAGAEGELYWGRFTLQGIAGVEFGNSVSNATTATAIQPMGLGFNPPAGVITTSTFITGFDVKTRFFDMVNLKYYFADNASAYVGHRFLGDKNALALGAEAALPFGHGIMGSAFIEGRVGEGDFHGVWGGIRFYFGNGDKPLIARHRTQDPNNWMPDNLFSILNSSTSSGSTSSTLFCDPPRTLLPDGSCEVGSFSGPPL